MICYGVLRYEAKAAHIMGCTDTITSFARQSNAYRVGDRGLGADHGEVENDTSADEHTHGSDKQEVLDRVGEILGECDICSAGGQVHSYPVLFTVDPAVAQLLRTA
jgi:hypothetical protein